MPWPSRLKSKHFFYKLPGGCSIDRMSLALQPLQTLSEQTHNLPTRTRFIGGEHELDTIEHLLANPDCWLLTLIRSRGIGKTHLALHVAERKVGAFLISEKASSKSLS